MPLEVAYAFDEVGGTVAIDASGNGRHLNLSGTNGVMVSGGKSRGALGKNGATMPSLPASVLAASQTDDRTLMFDAQSELTTWWVRFDDPAFGSGMWGLLDLGSGSMSGQARDNSGSHNLLTRPNATAPAAGTWHHYTLRYIRATGVCSIFRDGVFVQSQSFTAGTQLSTSATKIDLAEWSTTGPAIDNLRIFSHALSDAEIASLANSPVMPDSPMPIVTSGFHGPGPFGELAPWQGVPSPGSSATSADAAVAVTDSATATAATTKPVDGAVSATSTITAGAAAAKPVDTAVSAAATVAAASAVIKLADGSLAATATVATVAAAAKPVDGSTVATATIIVGAANTKPVDASVTTNASVTATTGAVKPADGPVTTATTITAGTSATKPTDASLTALATITADATIGAAPKTIDTAVAETVTLTAAAQAARPLDAASSVTAAASSEAQAVKPVASPITVLATISATASVTKNIAATQSITVTITAGAATVGPVVYGQMTEIERPGPSMRATDRLAAAMTSTDHAAPTMKGG